MSHIISCFTHFDWLNKLDFNNSIKNSDFLQMVCIIKCDDSGRVMSKEVLQALHTRVVQRKRLLRIEDSSSFGSRAAYKRQRECKLSGTKKI